MTSPVLCNINAAICHLISWACLGLRDHLKRRGGVVGTHFYVPTLLMTMPDSFRTEGGAGGGSSLTSRWFRVWLMSICSTFLLLGMQRAPQSHHLRDAPICSFLMWARLLLASGHLPSRLHLYWAPDNLTLRTATVFCREPGSGGGIICLRQHLSQLLNSDIVVGKQHRPRGEKWVCPCSRELYWQKQAELNHGP